MAVTVRRSTPDDARAISTIRIETWRAAYDGLIDDVLLYGLDVDRETERRAKHWDGYHADTRRAEFIAEIDGEPVGWAVAGPPLHNAEPHDGALYALYVLPAHWSTGVGHELLAAAERALREAGFLTAHLWVLEGNDRAATFYERHGWVEDGAVMLDERLVGDTGVGGLHERRRVRDLRPKA